MLTRFLGVPNTKPSAPVVDLSAQFARIKAIASIGRARAALTAEPPVVGTINENQPLSKKLTEALMNGLAFESASLAGTPTATAKDEPAEVDLGTGKG